MGGADVIRRYSNLYGYFLVQRFKILMEYRANFLIGMTSTVILQAAGLLTLWVVMSQIPDLNGWSFDELLLVYGLLTLSGSLNHMFADNLWILGDAYVRTGGFDRFLVRPIDPLFHLLADRFCHDGIGTFLIGSALVVKAWTALGIALTPFNLLYLTVAVLSSGAIFIALNLFTATSSFWVTMSTPVVWSVHSTSEFAKFPLSLYHGGVRVLMTWLLPYGFVSLLSGELPFRARGWGAGLVGSGGGRGAAVRELPLLEVWLEAVLEYGLVEGQRVKRKEKSFTSALSLCASVTVF